MNNPHMTSRLRQLAYDWLPPAIANGIRKITSKNPKQQKNNVVWDGDYATWEEALAASKGYDSENILKKVKDSTLKVKNGEAIYERDSFIFDDIYYSWPILAGLMWAAACNSGTLDVLDFGGSLGSSYFQNRNFLASLSDVHWSIVEQSHFVICGREFIQDDRLHFYPTIEECLLQRTPNVIMLSSVLQYLQYPYSILSKLSDVGAKCLLIDRTPFLDSDQDRIVIQYVPPEIYAANYPSWLFSKGTFLNYLSSNWNLLAEFECPEGLVRTGTGLKLTFNGLVLQSKK